jgi:hypothetical protein
MDKERIYLETYILQKDMRVRMPKTILANLPIVKGYSKFDIFLDKAANEIILKLHSDEPQEEDAIQ